MYKATINGVINVFVCQRQRLNAVYSWKDILSVYAAQSLWTHIFRNLLFCHHSLQIDLKYNCDTFTKQLLLSSLIVYEWAIPINKHN